MSVRLERSTDMNTQKYINAISTAIIGTLLFIVYCSESMFISDNAGNLLNVAANGDQNSIHLAQGFFAPIRTI